MAGRGLRRGLSTTVITLWLLSACADSTTLLSSLDDDTPTVEVVANGSMVSASESLQIRIEYPSVNSPRATRLRADLLDAEGTLVGTIELGAEELAEPVLPPIVLPEPPHGVYRLAIEAWTNGDVLFSRERRLFVLDQPPSIEGIVVRPATIAQDMEALVRIDVTTPTGTRPYVRWLIEGTPVKQGYVAEIGPRLVVEAAMVARGAHRVQAEVYPWGPDEGVRIDGVTTIEQYGDILVRDSVDTDPAVSVDTDPSRRLIRSFSFDGTLRAWSSADTQVAAEREGNTSLSEYAGALGYRVTDRGLIRVPMPLPTEAGTLLLYRIRLRTDSVDAGTRALRRSAEDASSDGGTDAEVSSGVGALSQRTNVSDIDDASGGYSSDTDGESTAPSASPRPSEADGEAEPFAEPTDERTDSDLLDVARPRSPLGLVSASGDVLWSDEVDRLPASSGDEMELTELVYAVERSGRNLWIHPVEGGVLLDGIRLDVPEPAAGEEHDRIELAVTGDVRRDMFVDYVAVEQLDSGSLERLAWTQALTTFLGQTEEPLSGWSAVLPEQLDIETVSALTEQPTAEDEIDLNAGAAVVNEMRVLLPRAAAVDVSLQTDSEDAADVPGVSIGRAQAENTLEVRIGDSTHYVEIDQDQYERLPPQQMMFSLRIEHRIRVAPPAPETETSDDQDSPGGEEPVVDEVANDASSTEEPATGDGPTISLAGSRGSASEELRLTIEWPQSAIEAGGVRVTPAGEREQLSGPAMVLVISDEE